MYVEEADGTGNPFWLHGRCQVPGTSYQKKDPDRDQRAPRIQDSIFEKEIQTHKAEDIILGNEILVL